MTALSQASVEYLRLRRSLGHDLAEAHRLLPRFVAYLDEIGSPTMRSPFRRWIAIHFDPLHRPAPHGRARRVDRHRR